MARSKRMIGGKVARRQAWPWQVAVVDRGETICGGVLISSHSLLTAAHCITSERNEFVINDYHSEITDYNERILHPYSIRIHRDYRLTIAPQDDLAVVLFKVCVCFY